MGETETAAMLAEPFGNISEIIAANAARLEEHPAIRDETSEMTWAQLGDRVERIAARLLEDGLERGQSVAILGYSSVAYALVFLAAVRAGGVAAPLTTSASAEQLAGMANDSGARHIFIDRARLDELGEDCFPGLAKIVLDEELDEWMAPEGTQAPRFDHQPSDPFNIIYSSGTTGTPKGIVHSHQMRWRQFAATAASWLEAGLEVRSLASTPLYSNTTMVAFLPALLAGGTVRVMGKFECLKWLDYAQADRTAITMLVPVQYQRLMDEPRFDEFDLSALTLKYCTSAPFSAELKREVLARMPGALIEIYSMTEGGVVCLLEAHRFPDKLHTVGRPAPGSELKVLDDEDREVPAGTPGNLVGRSHTMMSGYKNRPEQTREGYWTDPATGEVWQRMGDIGRVDEAGFLELVGRANDMIISGGFNIYPVDLENALLEEEDVLEAAVIGVPSRKWGETPVGFVRLGEVSRPAKDILAAVNARLGKTQRLSLLHVIEEMPRSHIGKLLKTELREEAERRGLPE
ncbi:class I adenylate-forming enzyme family protein [Qipengyuania sphaerica]|uniref:class I adenylate-forming enzyme family protein n=1 Tax=Qipengyuania sphaerica TaxID=2867243 RepID=UPI001C873BBE|nr:class I adenylate-forming enzyme family protein [Qipengyuania sphaerica]MBX7539420.1 acyl--CoA ligase [Qipengyuania sphaerica]